MNIAKEILRQLGGNKFLVMTGAKNLLAGDNYLTFRLPGTMTKNRINCIKITLNSLDTYDIQFMNIRGMNLKMISELKNIYCDQLKEIISNETGLALSLNPAA